MEAKFTERLHQVKEEFAVEITMATKDLKEKHNKDIGKLSSNSSRNIRGKHLGSFTEKQYEKLVAEKDEAVHTLENRVRIQVKDAENQIRYELLKIPLISRNFSFRSPFFCEKFFTHLCFV